MAVWHDWADLADFTASSLCHVTARTVVALVSRLDDILHLLTQHTQRKHRVRQCHERAHDWAVRQPGCLLLLYKNLLENGRMSAKIVPLSHFHRDEFVSYSLNS